MSVELATAYIALVPSAAGIGAALQKELGAPLEEMAKTSGEKTSNAFSSAFAIGAAAAAVAVVVGLEKIGSSFDDAADKIRTTTGATGVGLAALKDSFKAVVTTVPADFGDASTAIAGFNQKLGLSGKPLQDLASQVLNLSRITGTDLAGNVAATASLFNSWGTSAADQGPKLDELFRISQSTGISVQDLAKQMAEGGVQFRAAGLSFESSGALLGLLAKNGLSAADVVPALSKAMAQAAKDGKPAGDVFRDTFDAIRNAPDDTAAAGVALDVFGAKAGPKFAALVREGKLSYEELSASIAAGGDTINAASADTADWREKLKLLINQGMVKLEPIATKVFNAIGTAVQVVGPILGQLAAAFQASLGWLMDHREILIGIGVGVGAALVSMFSVWVVGASAAAVATIAAAAPFIAIGVAVAAVAAGVIYAYTHWEFFRVAVTAVKDFVTDKLVPAFQAVAGFIVDYIVPAFQAIWNFISTYIIPIISTLVETYIKGLVLEFNVVKAVITDVVIPAFKAVWSFIQDKVIPIFLAVVDTVASVASAVGDRISDIVGFVVGLPGRIGGVFVTLWDGLKDGIETARQWVSDKIDAVVSFATGLPGRMVGLFGGMWDGIKDAFRSAINFIIRGWNSLHFGMPSFDTHIPGVGKVGGFDIGVPTIHELHTGGIIPGVGDYPAVLEGGEMVLTRLQQTQLFTMANGNFDGGARAPAPFIGGDFINNRRDFTIGDMNQVLAMARLRQ